MLVDTEDVLQIIGYALLGVDDECKLGAMLQELAGGQVSLGGHPDGVPRAARPPGGAAMTAPAHPGGPDAHMLRPCPSRRPLRRPA